VSEKFSPEFQGGVQLQSALMGLTLAFRGRYGDEALKVAQAFSEQMGTMIGNQIKERAGINGLGIRDVEKLFHAWLDPILDPRKVVTSVEGDSLSVIRQSPTMCPAMIVAKQMNLPLKTVCDTVALQMFRGIARSVNPNAHHENVEMSHAKCVDKIMIR